MKRKIVLCIIITLMSFHAAFADGTKLSEVTISSQIPLSTNEQNEVAYGVNPISPWEYQSKLGKGMDVDWSKTRKGKENYNLKVVQDFEDAGIDHVRIRIKDKADNDLFVSLDEQIDDCINTGIIPIIAYQADAFKNNPNEENLQKVVDWWRIVAERYKDKSYLLSFDLLIEATDALNKQPEKLKMNYTKEL